MVPFSRTTILQNLVLKVAYLLSLLDFHLKISSFPIILDEGHVDFLFRTNALQKKQSTPSFNGTYLKIEH